MKANRLLSRPDWLLAIALLTITLLAYSPGWNGKPIWDDDQHLTKPELRSWNGLEQIWVNVGVTHQYYPLVHTVFWIEQRLWNDRLRSFCVAPNPSGIGGLDVGTQEHALSYVLSLFSIIIFKIRSNKEPVHVSGRAWLVFARITLKKRYLRFARGYSHRSVVETTPISLAERRAAAPSIFCYWNIGRTLHRLGGTAFCRSGRGRFQSFGH